MALLERVSTLIRANLNDLVDKAENPEVMIKQVILDMQNQLLQVKTQVAISIAAVAASHPLLAGPGPTRSIASSAELVVSTPKAIGTPVAAAAAASACETAEAM